MQPGVAYFRVSTAKQGRSGLGIEAQRAAMARFAEAGGYTLIAEFTEVETGKGSDALERRPQLAAALSAGKASENCVDLPQRSTIAAFEPLVVGGGMSRTSRTWSTE